MPSYGFEIRIRVARDSLINSDAEWLSLSVPSSELEFLLKPTTEGKAISDSRELIISGGEFTSKEQAAKVAEELRRSLLLSGAQLRIGIELNVEVFDEESRKFVIRFKMPYTPEAPQVRFHAAFERASTKSNMLSEKQTLALELYNLHHFETSKRARFLTLVIAVESLSERKERSEMAVNLVESIMSLASNSDLPDGEKQSLLSSLKDLKEESIGRTCRELVGKYLAGNQYGGMAAKKFFNECYSMRSQLVHDGELEDTGRFLDTWIYNLDQLVSDLLLATADENL